MDQSLNDQLDLFRSRVAALKLGDDDPAALCRGLEDAIAAGLASYALIRRWADAAGHVSGWRERHPGLPAAYAAWYAAAAEVLRLARESKRVGGRPAGADELARACVKAQLFATDFDGFVKSLDPSRPPEKGTPLSEFMDELHGRTVARGA